MRKTPIYIAAILLVASLVSFLFLRSYGNSNAGNVFIAVSDIQAGSLIKREDVKEIQWPEPSLPAGSKLSIDDIDGRVARATILSGELVLDSKLAPKDAKGGLSSVIAPGKRAITVKVNEVVAVAGFALPGSYVDVIVNAVDQQQQAFSKVVLEKVKVLAIAQETATDSSKPRVVNAVTLELTPVESEQLDLARNIGRLSLVLRNEFDQTSSATDSRGARVNDLLGRKPESSAPAANKKISNGVEEIRGTAKMDKGGAGL